MSQAANFHRCVLPNRECTLGSLFETSGNGEKFSPGNEKCDPMCGNKCGRSPRGRHAFNVFQLGRSREFSSSEFANTARILDTWVRVCVTIPNRYRSAYPRNKKSRSFNITVMGYQALNILKPLRRDAHGLRTERSWGVSYPVSVCGYLRIFSINSRTETCQKRICGCIKSDG